MTLVYCAGSSRRYGAIAVAEGYLYGTRSDASRRQPCPIGFVDLDWKRADLRRHLEFVREHEPKLAVAPDVVRLSDLGRTLRCAELLARFAERVIVVPKVPGVIERLPHEPWLVVGYSVPSVYGGADGVLLWELDGWPVHLLGGSPMRQLALGRYLDVYSADGNATSRAARYGVWYDGERDRWATRDPRVPLGPDLCYRAFERSCRELRAAWERLAREQA